MNRPSGEIHSRLTITRSEQPRTYALADSQGQLGSLRLARSRITSGEIIAGGQTQPVACHPRRWWQVDVGDPAAPLLELRRHDATIPGINESVAWELDGRAIRFHARLGTGNQKITIDSTGLRLPHASVLVNGEWPQRDLTMLACFFTVIARRRRSIILLSG